jgi:hypothetical protein
VIETRLTLDRTEKLIVAETMQDVEPILERNKALRSMTQKSDWGRHVAAIPCVIITKWLNEEWAAGNTSLRPFTPEFDLIVQQKLQDPDWKYLRTDSPTVQHTMGWVGD